MSSIPPPAQRALWLVTAFVNGAIVMGLELVAFRLYAPWFGYSQYVWGAMIGVVMIALSAGYWLGGALADRSDRAAPLYGVTLASGTWQAAMLLALTPLMDWLATLGAIAGPLVASLIIFTPPMIGLAMTAPFVTRLLARTDAIGRTVGNVSAISTVGSILGVFGTSFALVPLVGTRTTLITCCALTVLVSAVGLAVSRKKLVAAAVVPAALLSLAPPLGWSADALWVRESEYNLVRVIRREDQIFLALNDSHAAQTWYREGGGLTGRYFDLYALGPVLADRASRERERGRVLVLGMGAGAGVHATRLAAPDWDIDAVEIDPEVVAAAEAYFDIHPDEHLRVHVADARPFVAHDDGTYDVVHVDLFQGGVYQPFYLLTEEAFRAVRARMHEGSVLMFNVYDGAPDHPLLAAIVSTLRRVFPTVYELPAGRRNHVLLVFTEERSLDSVREALRREDLSTDVRAVAGKASNDVTEVSCPEGMVLTDDHAPVEELTRQMLARR